MRPADLINFILPMPFGTSSQLPPVKEVWSMKRDVYAFFRKQRFCDFFPRPAPLTQLADEIVVRFQNAVKRFAATFSMGCFGHCQTK